MLEPYDEHMRRTHQAIGRLSVILDRGEMPPTLPDLLDRIDRAMAVVQALMPSDDGDPRDTATRSALERVAIGEQREPTCIECGRYLANGTRHYGCSEWDELKREMEP